MRPLGCFAVDLDQVSLQVVFPKQVVKLLQGGASMGAVLLDSSVSLLACVIARGVHRHFVQ